MEGQLGGVFPGIPLHCEGPLQLHDLLQLLGRQSRQVIGQPRECLSRPIGCNQKIDLNLILINSKRFICGGDYAGILMQVTNTMSDFHSLQTDTALTLERH